MTVGPFDFRFVELFCELYALEQYMDSVESQLPDILKREEKKTYKTLRQKGYDKDEFERHQMYEQIAEFEEVLPRHFRSSILVTLWSIFESAIYEIAEEVRGRQNQEIRLRDIRGDDFLDCAQKYFNHIIKIPLNTEGTPWQHLKMFYKLRNAIVHANGRLENLRNDKTLKNIKKLVKTDIGIQEINGIIQFSVDLIKETFLIVLHMLQDLTEAVKSKYPEPNNS